MNKLLAVLISSAVLMTAGQAFAQPAGDTSSSGSSMSKDPSTMSDDGMAKKSKKHKRMHKKSKKSAAEDKGMGSDTDNMNKK